MKHLVFLSVSFSLISLLSIQNSIAATAPMSKGLAKKPPTNLSRHAESTSSRAQKIQDLKLLSELTGRKVTFKTDKELYAELTAAYKNHKTDQMRMLVKEFEVKYPRSELMDNAWYTMGLASMENSDYNDALVYFQRIEKQAPQSDRAGPARLAKAIMYKRMNLLEVAEQNLRIIKKRYPGSPESARADMELKLIK